MPPHYSLVVIGGLGAALLACGGEASSPHPDPSGGRAAGGASATGGRGAAGGATGGSVAAETASGGSAIGGRGAVGAAGGSVAAETGGTATGGSSRAGPPAGGTITGGSPTGGVAVAGGSTESSGGLTTGGSAGNQFGTGGAITGGAAGSGASAGSTGSQGAVGGAAGQSGLDQVAGAAGFAASMPVAACQTDEDCTLQNDCCRCEAQPIGAAPAACDKACTDLECTQYGPDVTAVCYRGFCVLDVECEQGELTCTEVEPTCGPGKVPTVVDGCWGPCVDARECRSVPSLDYCAEGDIRLTNALLGSSEHCIEVPSVCTASPDCSCLGEAVCTSVCTDTGPGEITCICPGC